MGMVRMKDSEIEEKLKSGELASELSLIEWEKRQEYLGELPLPKLFA
jgi:hypothetical protein